MVHYVLKSSIKCPNEIPIKIKVGEMMKKTAMFVITFLGTLLIVSSIPLYLYLNAPENQGLVNPEVPKKENPETPDQINPEAPSPIMLNKFFSYEELKDYVEKSPQIGYYTLDGRGVATFDSGKMPVPSPNPAPEPMVSDSSKESSNSEYSTTNIQVKGVDEADIIKTDGEYIYMISNNTIIILKAYPAEEAEILSRISSNGTLKGIFINEDKLAVFEDEYTYYTIFAEPAPSFAVEAEPTIPIYGTPKTSIKVYDVSDREQPILERDFAIDGNYFNSRMIGDYVYAIANQYTYTTETDVILPRIYPGNQTEEILATDIYYYNLSDYYYTFTTIIALNIQDETEEPNHETILLGGSRAIYVSINNIYLTFPEYPMEVAETERTAIHRIGIDEESITFEATGVVPGVVLDQFSMDEHKSYFRIATTSGRVFRTFAQATSENNLYVLEMDLNIVGKLEDLALGEEIYSVRFMGDKGYIVTFRKIDPLFVIDLKEPTEPKVLGQLKVTGYSDYLQPYDENHLIGIGKETEAAEEGDFAWYQGVKISLFDVSDVSNPVEIAKYEIGDRGTESPVLDDHRALLFDKERNLLVTPVLVAKVDETQYTGEVPPNAYGEFVYQGAYIFDISLDGLELRGRITHMDDNADLLKSGYWFYSEYAVKRSLYIDNVLYTISAMKVKMNNLETLGEINQVELS